MLPQANSSVSIKLFHAMMAVSALSLARQNGGQTIDSLQHYQKALPPQGTLRSHQDLLSDGLFLTHFLLLVYEVSAVMSVLSSEVLTAERLELGSQGSRIFGHIIFHVSLRSR